MSGDLWHAHFDEVTWILELDELPHGQRLGIDAGLSKLMGNTPTRPSDCPVLLHAENMQLGPLAERSAIVKALDLTSD